MEEIHLQCLQTATGVSAIPTGAHVRDDEQVCHSTFCFSKVGICYCCIGLTSLLSDSPSVCLPHFVHMLRNTPVYFDHQFFPGGENGIENLKCKLQPQNYMFIVKSCFVNMHEFITCT